MYTESSSLSHSRQATQVHISMYCFRYSFETVKSTENKLTATLRTKNIISIKAFKVLNKTINEEYDRWIP